MKLNPTVCVVGNDYQIIVVTNTDALISVVVGDKVFYNHTNGIRRSAAGVHKITVPAKLLDQEKKYTLKAQEMLERKPYFSRLGSEVEATYNFRPIEKTKNINIYHIADIHGEYEQAVAMPRASGADIDLFIMNGDISSASDTFEEMILCYEIASQVTKGEIPCVISRGNHDLRGNLAENLAAFMPDKDGKSYYTFKVGCVWGILVDVGEDKVDSHPEYASTICCHNFRLEQEKMILDTIRNSAGEYADEGVKYRLVISHVPFTFKFPEPFNIERELYTKWSVLMKENIEPQLMLCGHTHEACISYDGGEYDELGQPCPIVVGADVTKNEEGKAVLSGALITLKDGFAEVSLNGENGILFEERIKF